MLVTSQLPIQTTTFAIISFQRALVPTHFEKGSATHGSVNAIPEYKLLLQKINQLIGNKLLIY